MHPVQTTDHTKAPLIEAVVPSITEPATETPEMNTTVSREIAHILDSRSVGFLQQTKRSRDEQNYSSSASCQDRQICQNDLLRSWKGQNLLQAQFGAQIGNSKDRDVIIDQTS